MRMLKEGGGEQLVVLRSVRMSAFPLSGASDRQLSLSVTPLSVSLTCSLSTSRVRGGPPSGAQGGGES